MEEAPSPTDVSSSLSEFVRQERILKELYQDGKEHRPSREFEPLRYNNEEIDNILQQMGRLLSPVGQESDNKVYQHVIAETENKSIEQILNEAKELINDSLTVADCASILSTDDVSSVFSTDDVTFINIEDSNDTDEVNGNYHVHDRTTLFPRETLKLATSDVKNGNSLPVEQKPAQPATEFSHKRKSHESPPKTLPKNRNEEFRKEMQILRDEARRINQLYESCKVESVGLRREMARLQLQWEQREKELLEENRQLKKHASSSSTVSLKEFENFQSKIDSANETINYLKANLSKVNEEWRKKEMRLIHECGQLRHQLKSSPKFAQPDVERLQEQLKDTQELNVKLKMDFESYRDKCTTLEGLCADLKKVILDEQIAEKLYANDDTPASVKHFLASSPTSMLNTLTHMFGCLSRSARGRPYCGQKDKSELFTTHESSMMHDLAKSHEHHDLIRELLKEKEQLRKENVDLNRQVKELETIVRRRAHPNFSNVSDIIKSGESKMYEKETETIKNLKKELLDKQQVIIGLKNQMIETKAAYDESLLSLQTKVVRVQEENSKMREEMEKASVRKVATTTTATTSATTANGHAPKCKRKLRSGEPPAHSAARNFRVELSAKEREVNTLNKQIDELKKTNRKLMRDREVHHLSSKEQSAENIQLNRKFTRGSRENENVPVNPSSPKRKVDNDGQNLVSSKHEEAGPVEEKSPEAVDLNTQVDVQRTSDEEAKSQNLPQVLCDLLKILAKEKCGEKIKNSSDEVGQSEEVRQFFEALKNYSH